jgi:hypothetical protein
MNKLLYHEHFKFILTFLIKRHEQNIFEIHEKLIVG